MDNLRLKENLAESGSGRSPRFAPAQFRLAWHHESALSSLATVKPHFRRHPPPASSAGRWHVTSILWLGRPVVVVRLWRCLPNPPLIYPAELIILPSSFFLPQPPLSSLFITTNIRSIRAISQFSSEKHLQFHTRRKTLTNHLNREHHSRASASDSVIMPFTAR